MDRREILKSGLFAAGSILLLPELLSFSDIRNGEVKYENYNAIKLFIGELETYILCDGIISLPSVQPIFAPDTEKSMLNDKLRQLHSPSDHVETGINVMVIRKDAKVILLDTGSGHHFGTNGGKLTASLKTIGLSPENITDIVITHAHIDHIGGILNADEAFIFPHAKYHIAKTEYDFWMSDTPDFSDSKGDKSTADFNISFAKHILSKITNRIQFFDYGEELFSCLLAELAAGHTPGHTIFTIYSGTKSLKHLVDAFHIPLLVSQPEWGTQWDTDFNKAVETRKKIIREGVAHSTLFMSCHLPWPGLGFIDQIGGEYYWNMYHYANPMKLTV